MIDIFSIIFILSLIAGILVNFVGIPGNAVISINSLVYAIIEGFHEISIGFLLLIIAMGIAVEFLEYLSIAFSSQKFGASRKSVWGAIIGGGIGAFSGFFITPVLGSFLGSLAGVILGAVFLEFRIKGNLSDAFRAGLGAFLGKIGGLSIKMIGSIVMTTTVLYHILG